LGSHIATTGRLDDEAVERALAALRRFKVLSHQAGADDIYILATAAAREAENGPAFIEEAQNILENQVHVLSGAEEARYAALGIVCGFEKPIGISADMGGGSVEFIAIDEKPKGTGITLPLGGLRLREVSGGSVKEARNIVRKAIAGNTMLKQAKGGVFYAVGGTWRAIGRMHQARYNYPLSIMHNYELDNEAARKICRRLLQPDADRARGMKAVSSNRRDLIPFGAALLYEIIKVMEPEKIVISGLGVREGYLYSLLPPKVQKADPLITAAEEMAVQEARYRKASCLLADVTWRSHPDYRGGQALNLLSNANYVGVDHPGRAYIALASYYRHEGLISDDTKLPLREIATDRINFRARLTGALFRVAFLMSAAMPGVLSKIKFEKSSSGHGWALIVPEELANFEGERLNRRIAALETVLQAPVNWCVVS